MENPERRLPFPKGQVTLAQVTEGLNRDLDDAIRVAEELRAAARVRPEDLQLQVSM